MKKHLLILIILFSFSTSFSQSDKDCGCPEWDGNVIPELTVNSCDYDGDNPSLKAFATWDCCQKKCKEKQRIQNENKSQPTNGASETEIKSETDNSYKVNSVDFSNNTNQVSTDRNYPTSNKNSQTQATTNAINSAGNILGSIIQNANESAERNAQIEAQRIADINTIIAERKRELKDGKGSFDSQNRKTGEWTFYYPQSTAPMSNGMFKDGKKEGMWLIYEDESYRSSFSEKIKEAILYENGDIKERYKARTIKNYFPDVDDPEFLTLSATALERNGEQILIGKYIKNNKVGTRIAEGEFNRYGKKEGKWIFGYDRIEKTYFQLKKFKIKSEEYFEDGKLDGVQKTYFINGNVEYIYNYKNGLKNGVEKKFNRDGNLISEDNYLNGDLSERKYYFESGQLKGMSEYKNGKMNGLSIAYFENGGVSSQGTYKNNNFVEGSGKKYSAGGSEVLNTLESNNGLKLNEYFSDFYEHFENSFTNAFYEKDFHFYIARRATNINMVNCNEKVKEKYSSLKNCDKVQTDDYNLFRTLRFKQANKWGILSKKGKIITTAKWDYILENHNFEPNEFYIVVKDHKFNALNKKGNLIFSSFYDAIDFWKYDFKKDTHFIVIKNWKFGILDKKGKVILPIEYDFIGLLHKEGIGTDIARVCKDGKWGYINGKLELVIPIIYDKASVFDDKPEQKGRELVVVTFAEVTLDGETFMINDKGNRIH